MIMLNRNITFVLIESIDSVDGDIGVGSSWFKNFSNRKRHGLISFPFVFAGVIWLSYTKYPSIEKERQKPNEQ